MYYTGTSWVSLDELPAYITANGSFAVNKSSEVKAYGTCRITLTDTEITDAALEEGAVYINRSTGIAYVFDGTNWNEISCNLTCRPLANAAISGDNYLEKNSADNGKMFAEFAYWDGETTAVNPENSGLGSVDVNWYLSKTADHADKLLKKNTSVEATAGNATIEEAHSYTITDQMLVDGYLYVGVGIVPYATEAASLGEESIAWLPIENCAPILGPVAVQGDVTGADDSVIQAEYAYYDKENNEEGTHQYQWESASDASGMGASDAGSAQTYTVRDEDWGKYYRCTITPKAKYGKIIGDPKTTAWRRVENCGPFTHVNISGDFNSGLLVGEYAMRDKEDNPYALQNIKWYRNSSESTSGATVISSGTSNFTYTLQNSDVDQYIGYSVTGVATKGKLQGDEYVVWKLMSNCAPHIGNARIQRDGNTLRGEWSAYDAENNTIDEPEYSWLRNGTVVSSAQSYTLTAADVGTSITLKITPKATVGKLQGDVFTTAAINISSL
ncbi:hypothetical protein [Marinifilum breve]|nr:hypothetical protein [Marinifilum breve]